MRSRTLTYSRALRITCLTLLFLRHSLDLYVFSSGPNIKLVAQYSCVTITETIVLTKPYLRASSSWIILAAYLCVYKCSLLAK